MTSIPDSWLLLGCGGAAALLAHLRRRRASSRNLHRARTAGFADAVDTGAMDPRQVPRFFHDDGPEAGDYDSNYQLAGLDPLLHPGFAAVQHARERDDSEPTGRLRTFAARLRQLVRRWRVRLASS